MSGNKYTVLFLVFVSYFFLLNPVFAGEYVLPYPSYMPGNKLYAISRISDLFSMYWSFGNLAQHKTRLGLSDTYLVESKVLFEYKQYKLARDALERSDEMFVTLPGYIQRARAAGIDVGPIARTTEDAAAKHVAVLSKILEEAPEEFVWEEEKEDPIILETSEILESSIRLRVQIASQAASAL